MLHYVSLKKKKIIIIFMHNHRIWEAAECWMLQWQWKDYRKSRSARVQQSRIKPDPWERFCFQDQVKDFNIWIIATVTHPLLRERLKARKGTLFNLVCEASQIFFKPHFFDVHTLKELQLHTSATKTNWFESGLGLGPPGKFPLLIFVCVCVLPTWVLMQTQ